MAAQRPPHRQHSPDGSVTRRHGISMLLRPAMAALLVLPAAALAQQSAISPAVSAEIGFLLDAVARSSCEFRRNGSWYRGPAAEGHLRDKLRYFADKQQIASAEQFIDRAATRSEMSGLAYEVRCQGSAIVPMGTWLHDQLVQRRATHK
jgi:hypothetical protein